MTLSNKKKRSPQQPNPYAPYYIGMKEIRITLEPTEKIDKLIEYYDGGKRIGWEIRDESCKQIGEMIAVYFFPPTKQTEV